jgi:ankyrin repeat protein
MAEEVPLAVPASEESTQRSTDPRSALLAAILSYNIEAVRHLLSDECLSALREAFGEEVSDQELRTSLLTQDGTTTSLLMTACSIGNYEAVRLPII